MNWRASLLILALALAGCGHDVYEKANTTDAELVQDENSCFGYAEMQPQAAIGYVRGGYQLNIEKERRDIHACMVAKGYNLKPRWPFGPYGTSPPTGYNANKPLDTPRL